MFLFERTNAQLQRIEDKLGAIYQDIDALLRSSNGVAHVSDELMQSLHELQHCRACLNLQHDVTQQLNKNQSLEAVINTALEAVWMKAPLSFAVIVLGEAELGPYQYRGLKGIPNSWRYLNKECAFPLSGVLARALLQRLDPNEPDYLYVPDLKTAERPTPDEFPWIPQQGSLLILPLRNADLARGALLLGRNEVDGFADPILREEYQGITTSITKAIEHAQIKDEVNKNTEQLVDAQLLTREITNAQHFDAVIDALTQKLPEVLGWVDVQVVVRKPQHVLDYLETEHQPYRQSVRSTDSPNGAAEYVTDGDDAKSATLLDTHLFAQSQSSEQEATLNPKIQHLFHWTMEVGEPVFYDPNNLDENPEHPYYSDSGRALIVPISRRNSRFGIIHVVLRDPLRRFDECDMVVLRTIANSTATALHNVELVYMQEWERIDSMFTLIAAAEKRIPELDGHNRRVMYNATRVAHYLDLDPQSCLLVRAGAALHDVAMIQLSDDEVLQLYRTNWDEPYAALLRSHRGSQLLAESKLDKQIVSLVARQGAPLAQTEFALPDSFSTLHEHFSQATWSPPESPHTKKSTTVSHRNGHFQRQANVDSLVSQQGAAIITVVDAFDMFMCMAAPDSSPAPLTGLQYLRQHRGVRFDPKIVQVYGELIAQDCVQLPS